MDQKDYLLKVIDNINNYVWYKLSKMNNKLYESYTVNAFTNQLYAIERGWTVATRKDLRDMADDMFTNNGYESFKKLSTTLQNFSISKSKLSVIIFLCVQLSDMYIQVGEIFAVKYIISIIILWSLYY